MGKPVIGITNYYLGRGESGEQRPRGLHDQDIGMFSYDHVRSVEAAGGIPVILPIQKTENLEALLNSIDGLLLAGGADINPALYGESPHIALGAVEEERDHFEYYLTKAAMQSDIPILGICRGVQMLNVAAGGTLYQDLPSQLGTEYFHAHTQFRKWQPTHTVKLLEGSRVQQAFERTELAVNSLHHQAIKQVAPGFQVTAQSADGIVEAIESRTHAYVVGVQWHPEMMVEKVEEQLQLFVQFVQHC